MENSMAKDVITQMYAEFKLYHHYTVENWGILCSALGCAVEALELQIPKKLNMVVMTTMILNVLSVIIQLDVWIVISEEVNTVKNVVRDWIGMINNDK